MAARFSGEGRPAAHLGAGAFLAALLRKRRITISYITQLRYKLRLSSSSAILTLNLFVVFGSELADPGLFTGHCCCVRRTYRYSSGRSRYSRRVGIWRSLAFGWLGLQGFLDLGNPAFYRLQAITAGKRRRVHLAFEPGKVGVGFGEFGLFDLKNGRHPPDGVFKAADEAHRIDIFT